MSGGRSAAFVRRLRRLPMARNGSTAVEFAIIVPLLLSLSFGIIEFGRAVWMRNTMQSVVELATRCYALDRTELTTRNCDTAAKVQTFAVAAATSAGVNNLVTGDFAVSEQLCGKQVIATYSFQPVVPFIPAMQLRAKSCRAATPAP